MTILVILTFYHKLNIFICYKLKYYFTQTIPLKLKTSVILKCESFKGKNLFLKIAKKREDFTSELLPLLRIFRYYFLLLHTFAVKLVILHIKCYSKLIKNSLNY